MMNKGILLFLLLMVSAVFIVGCAQKTIGDNSTAPTGNSNAISPQDLPAAPPPVPSSAKNPANTAPSSVKDLNIEAYSFGFDQTGSAINKGDTVKLTFSVRDGQHSFLLPAYNIEFSAMPAGSVQTATFIAGKSGTFEYSCNEHPDMIGKLVVN